MPNLTPEGRRVIVGRGLTKKLESYQLVDAYKLILMIADIRLLEETEGVAGHVYIFDADIVQPSHLGTISLAELKKFFVCIQEAYPLKLKQVHVVNTSKLIDVLYNNFTKPFLKEKIRNRVFFHKDCTGLHEYIPKDVLPIEYGGTSCSLEEVTNTPAYLAEQVNFCSGTSTLERGPIE